MSSAIDIGPVGESDYENCHEIHTWRGNHRCGSARVLRVFDLLIAEGAWVPALWRWEVANVLQMNVKRGRHGGDFRDHALAALTLLPIRVDPVSEQQAWSEPVELAERHKLTVYDAAYLELALRRKIPLASLDHPLRASAVSEAIELLGE